MLELTIDQRPWRVGPPAGQGDLRSQATGAATASPSRPNRPDRPL